MTFQEIKVNFIRRSFLFASSKTFASSTSISFLKLIFRQIFINSSFLVGVTVTFEKSIFSGRLKLISRKESDAWTKRWEVYYDEIQCKITQTPTTSSLSKDKNSYDRRFFAKFHVAPLQSRRCTFRNLIANLSAVKQFLRGFSNYRRPANEEDAMETSSNAIRCAIHLFPVINNQNINYLLTSRASICPLLPKRDYLCTSRVPSLTAMIYTRPRVSRASTFQ